MSEVSQDLSSKKFKNKSNKSNRKLQKILGQKIPVDVNIRDIEKLGLRAILESRVPLCYFLYQLLEDYSSENLFFYLEVDLYEHSLFEDPDMKVDVGVELYDIFLATDSEFEVNIPQKVKGPILEAIQSGQQNAFKDAKEHIMKLMDPVFMQFRNGPLFVQMQRELGYTTVYSKQERNYGVRILLQNLDKTLSADRSASLVPGITPLAAQTRNDMIRAMLHAFCQMKLGIDFVDSNESSLQTPQQTSANSTASRKASDPSVKKAEIHVQPGNTMPDIYENQEEDTFATYLDNM